MQHKKNTDNEPKNSIFIVHKDQLYGALPDKNDEMVPLYTASKNDGLDIR